jgi:hypothetical protein
LRLMSTPNHGHTTAWLKLFALGWAAMIDLVIRCDDALGEHKVAFGKGLDRLRHLLHIEPAHFLDFASQSAEIGVECARRMIDHIGLPTLHTVLGARQLREIEP